MKVFDLPEARKELAYNMIFYDLSRQDETLSIEQNIIVSLNGRNVNAPIHVKHNDKKYIICLSGSLSPGLPIEQEIQIIYREEQITDYVIIPIPG